MQVAEICRLIWHKLDPAHQNELPAHHMLLAHVLPDKVNDIKSYIGPFEPNKHETHTMQVRLASLPSRPMSYFTALTSLPSPHFPCITALTSRLVSYLTDLTPVS